MIVAVETVEHGHRAHLPMILERVNADPRGARFIALDGSEEDVAVVDRGPRVLKPTPAAFAHEYGEVMLIRSAIVVCRRFCRGG